MITSTQNEKVKLVQALQKEAKTRRKTGKIVLEGVRLVGDALRGGQQPDFLLYTPDHTTVLPLVEAHQERAFAVSDDVMRYATDTQQPQGVIGVFAMPRAEPPADPRRILILDSIRDPGNMGTILRTAAAAGVEAVLLSPTCVDPYNPKALRGGMGAHFRISVLEANWDTIRKYCYNTQITLADSQGEQRYDRADWSKPWSLIVGGEAHGAGEEALALAERRIYIPMAAETESLNAATAASVILFEARRQRESGK
jgi:RNA methyltransferase, TrmH family